MKIKITTALILLALVIFVFFFLPSIVNAQVEFPFKIIFPLIFQGAK